MQKDPSCIVNVNDLTHSLLSNSKLFVDDNSLFAKSR